MKKKMPNITVCGLNPSWQKTLLFDHFRPGEVNRSTGFDSRASGKGINFSRAVRTWGLASPKVYQFTGGDNGKKLISWLQDEGIAFEFEHVEAETRCCTTVLCGETGVMTELIEPSPLITESAAAALQSALFAGLEHADALALCGTIPPGPLQDIYPNLTARAADSGRIVLLDSVAQFMETLAAGAQFVKINSGELLAVTESDSIERAALRLLETFPVRGVAVTDGPGKAVFAERGRIHFISIPTISTVRNPIGAGDVCSGVMLSEILAGTSPLDAFAAGLAAACASCTTLYAAEFSKAKAEAIRAEILTQNELEA